MISTISRKALLAIYTDFLALAFVYFMPTLAHLSFVPLYFFEPFRIIVLSSLVLMGNKNNALLLALTLPAFSFIVSGHPIALKMIIMTFELSLNVWLYHLLSKRTTIVFLSLFVSIITSKGFYYILKYGLVSAGFLSLSTVSTPLWIQLLTAITLSVVLGVVVMRNKR